MAAECEIAASTATPAEAPAYGEKPGVLKAVAGKLLTIELVILTLLVAVCVAPSLFGISTYGILTGSMRPAFNAGDLVFVDTGVSGGDLSVGDVAAFDIGDGRIVTHRVVAIDPDSRTLITKGDANESADPNPVAYESVFGETIGAIPYAGNALLAFTENKAICLLAIGGLTLLLGLLAAFLPNKKTTSKD